MPSVPKYLRFIKTPLSCFGIVSCAGRVCLRVPLLFFIVPRPRLQICAIFAIKPQYTAPIITSEIITARYNWIFQRFGRVA